MTGGVEVEVGAGSATVSPDVDLVRAREVLAMLRAGRSTYGRAAIVLGVPPQRLAGDRDDRALAVYRAYVGRVVAFVSPLALRAGALNGVSVDELALLLRPDAGWEHWLCGPRPGDEWRASNAGRKGAGGPAAAQLWEWSLQAWLHGGVFVGGSGSPMTLLGVRVLDAGLEMAATVGRNLLRTRGREGWVELGGQLPETVAAALPGRSLDRLVGHPLIDGSGCVVTGVEDCRPPLGTRVRFALEPIPWRMPWARARDATVGVNP